MVLIRINHCTIIIKCVYKWTRALLLHRNDLEGKRKMQAVGLEPTRANTLRPERSTLDHSVTLASEIVIHFRHFL